MVITTSPNVSNFDFDALLDISTATAKAVLTDISTYISGGQANIIGINFKIIDPNNIAFHDTVYPPDIDLTPGLTDFEVNLPSFNGAVKWGVYKIYATLIDEDGTQYQWEENGLNYKAIKLCKPNTLIGAKGNFGGMQLLSDFDCDTNTLLVEDGTGYVYNGVAATETDTDVTVTYPVDPTGTPSYQTSTFMPFTLPISLSGVYSISAQVIQTYQYTETTSVKVAYKYQKSTDVQCGFTLCKALCEYERLANDIKNCVFKSVAETQEKQKQYLLISGLLVKILSFGKVCGKSFNTATILEEIREIGGFDCNCDCTPAAIIPQPVYAHNTIVKGSMCGDIDMVLQQVGSSVLINLSDKHYEFDVDESIADWVTFTPVTDGCTITYDVNIDFCAAIAALGCGGGGSGSVTNFSAGNLSPLFTTSVATSTTTPALTFAQVSQNQNLVYASPDGVAGFPTFRALVAGDLPSLTGLYWGLSGNATGNDTSFLGTTTNNDFLFKTNSTTRGAFFKTGELGIGISSSPLGTLHVKGASGQSPLYVENNAGTHIWENREDSSIRRGGNLFSRAYSTTVTTWGYLAGNNNSGGSNTFIGGNAGLVNAATTNNTFVGYNSGAANIASSNAFYGKDSGLLNTTGTQATYIGTASGAGITTGTKNTILGYHAGEQSGTAGTGGENVVLGNNTARYLLGFNNFLAGSELGGLAGSFTSGSGNIIISDHGLLSAGTTVNTCIIFGNTASASGRTSSIGIGHSVALTADNQYVMGSTSYYITEHVNFYSSTASHATYFRTSTPESNQIGNPGDLAYVNDATNGFIYLKYSGVGTNTGWLQLLTSGASGTIPVGTIGQTLYYAANGNVVTATSNLFNDGTNVGIGIAASNLFEMAGGAYSLLARVTNSGNIVFGDINGDVNSTYFSVSDAAGQISFNAINGFDFSGIATFQNDVVINAKLTVTGAIDPTHLYLDEQSGDPTNVANKGILYTKDVAGLTQLYYMNSAGTVYGITPNTAGTVTTVSVTTANGISGSVATATTTPAITLTLGAITPTSVNGNTISTGTGTLSLSTFTLTVAGNASISGTNTGDQTLAGLGGANAALSNLASVAINTTLLPQTNDVPALGSATLSFSDLFLASGALINFANGDSVITHSSGILTVSTGDLRVTTAGTNSASVVTVGGSQTLTGKSIVGTQLTGTSYTFPANNTNGTASMTLQPYEDHPLATYAGTITWNSTPPSTIVTQQYAWSRIGNTVTLFISVLYTSAGTTNTTVTFTIPSDCPSPVVFANSGDAASEYMFPINGGRVEANQTANPSAIRGGIRRNAGNSAFEIALIFGSTGALQAQVTVIYRTS